MQQYPTILNLQPFLTGSRLGSWSNFENKVLYDLWFKRMIELCKDRHYSDFILLVKSEPSYKRCCVQNTVWMMYKFPFGTFRLPPSDTRVQEYINDTRHISRSTGYLLIGYDFSERNQGLMQIITREASRRSNPLHGESLC